MTNTAQEGGDADLPPPSIASPSTVPRALTPGDWVQIDYQGRTVIGMIDRLWESLYTFSHWEGGVLAFGTVKPTQIGDWDEELTTQFRRLLPSTRNVVLSGSLGIVSTALAGETEIKKGISDASSRMGRNRQYNRC